MLSMSELYALKNIFKKTEGIKVNATKSIIGHCMAAAGGMKAIATIKAIQTGWVHPTINQFKAIDRRIHTEKTFFQSTNGTYGIVDDHGESTTRRPRLYIDSTMYTITLKGVTYVEDLGLIDHVKDSFFYAG
ncbi:thiolase-like protein [Artemisia annua]|uniref:beta-ketoacyl-[acyl-carrier-protein] synthase I n=1 Tax=Artemisia annua TaxID=35608 RepID=A0A2U1LVN7_ARTAN|nr:thiolase-like protein [Artemisia annua]